MLRMADMCPSSRADCVLASSCTRPVYMQTYISFLQGGLLQAYNTLSVTSTTINKESGVYMPKIKRLLDCCNALTACVEELPELHHEDLELIHKGVVVLAWLCCDALEHGLTGYQVLRPCTGYKMAGALVIDALTGIGLYG